MFPEGKSIQKFEFLKFRYGVCESQACLVGIIKANNAVIRTCKKQKKILELYGLEGRT